MAKAALLYPNRATPPSAGVDRSATVSLPPSASYWRGSAGSWWPVAVLCWGDTVTNRGYTVANRRAVGGHPYLCLGSVGLCRGQLGSAVMHQANFISKSGATPG